MQSILDIIKLVVVMMGYLVLIAYAVGLLMVLLITTIYFCGYTYDSLFGNWLLRIGKYISKKIPYIKKFVVLQQLKKKMEPKNIYLRYETPFCSYCLSYPTLIITYGIISEMEIKYGVLWAFLLYISMYFVGMYRRCKISKEYYEKVLENNLSFLKLSFVPLTFIITVVGFVCTITGTKIQELDVSNLNYIYTILVDYKSSIQSLDSIIHLVIISIFLLIIIYVASIPMQLLSYFIIMVIKYFRNYNRAYKRLINHYRNIVKRIFRMIFN